MHAQLIVIVIYQFYFPDLASCNLETLIRTLKLHIVYAESIIIIVVHVDPILGIYLVLLCS